MKVLLAAHHSPPNYQGGVEWVTLHGAQWLKAHGHQVEIASVEEIRANLDGEVFSRVEEYQGISIHRLSIPASSPSARFETSYWNVAIESWFEQYFSKNHPDILHLHSGYLLTLSALEAASRSGIASVLSLHDYWTVCPRINLLHPNGDRCPGPEKNRCAWCLLTEKRRFQWPEALIGKSLQKFVGNSLVAHLIGMEGVAIQVQQRQDKINAQLQQVEVIMALGTLTRDLILKQGVDPEKIMLSPNGLKTSSWQKTLNYKVPSDKLRIGYLGNLTPIKGAHVLVKAFRQLRSKNRELELRLYGNPAKAPEYARQLRWLAGGDERIQFMGAYENHRVPELFRELDVLVVPSLWYEVCPLVILEGQACLTPVIVSNLPNMSNQIIDGVDGLTFEAGNDRSLTTVLQRLLDEPGLLAHLTYGIRPIRSHDEQMQDWLMAYQKALEKRA